ncbi:MAG: OmpH family outer membrane protein [Chitinophagaceae bacterium]
MKNFTLGLNIVLVIAVAFLFYLHFSSSKVPKAASNTNVNKQTSGFKIAYIEMDSIQNNFEYYKQIAKELGASEQKKRNELNVQKNAFAAKVKEYQSKGQSMTQAEYTQAQQDLAQREKDYQVLEQTKAQEMQEENFKKLQDVKKKIEDFLKDYNKDNTYSFILVNSPDLIYYKDSAYNITNDVIKGLNQLYKKKN